MTSQNRRRAGACAGPHGRRNMLVFGLLLAVAMGAAMGYGGGVGTGLFGFGLVAGYTVLVVALGNRFDPMAVLSATRTDERRKQIDQAATATAGRVLIVVLACGTLWEIANGRSGPFVWLCALAGAAYIASVIYYSRRS